MWPSFWWPETGGVQTFAGQLARALHARGHDICVVTAHGVLDAPDHSCEDGIAVHRFHFKEAVESRNPAHVLSIKKQLLALDREFSPELVHVNCIGANVLFLLMTMDASITPSVLTLHWNTSDPLSLNNAMLNKAMHSARKIVAVSRYQIDDIKQFLPALADKCLWIANGTTPVSAETASQPLPPDPNILCLGRLVGEKGFDIAISAFAKISDRFPSAILTIAGDGVERESLMQQARSSECPHKIQFTGRVAHADVPATIGRSSFVVMPSRFEPFGLVALEAGRMARPVIASAVGGLSDIIVNNETGLLVREGDVSALADAMTRLLTDAQEVWRLGSAARIRVDSIFSDERTTTMYEELFQRTIGE